MTYPPSSGSEPASHPGPPDYQAGQPEYRPGQPEYQPSRPGYQPGPGYQQAGQPQYPAGPAYQQQPYQGYPQQYPGAPAAQSAPAGPKRGRTPLLLALIFGVIGLVLAIIGIVFFGVKSYSAVNSFSRVSVAAGSGTAHLASAGNYLAYYEAPNVSNNITSVPLPVVALRSPAGHLQVLNTLYGGASRTSGNISTKLTYDYNGHHGVAIYQFHAPQAGTYDVLVRGTGSEAPGADVAFGKSIGTDLALGVGLFVPGILLIVAAVVLLIVGLVLRSRSNRPTAPYGAPPGYGYSPQQPPPQQDGWQQPPPAGQPPQEQSDWQQAPPS